LPPGYDFVADANEVSKAVLQKSTWAVLGLTLDIELFTQLHYRQSIESDESLSPLFRDVFLYHWKEESQHAILDELEWVRHDTMIDAAERDSAVDDLIDLVNAVDEILVAQASGDARYFAETCGRKVTAGERRAIEATFLEAYRWTYIHSGAEHRRFSNVLSAMVSETQGTRIQNALKALH